MDNDGWISVEERLPDTNNNIAIFEKSKEYIVCFGDGTVSCRLFCRKSDYQDEGFYHDEFGKEDSVTHWQPLPQPPKE